MYEGAYRAVHDSGGGGGGGLPPRKKLYLRFLDNYSLGIWDFFRHIGLTAPPDEKIMRTALGAYLSGSKPIN